MDPENQNLSPIKGNSASSGSRSLFEIIYNNQKGSNSPNEDFSMGNTTSQFSSLNRSTSLLNTSENSTYNDGDSYYKGFYEGLYRKEPWISSRSLLSFLGPVIINTLLIIGPIWFLQRMYRSALKTATSTMSSTGSPKSNTKVGKDNIFQQMMQMMNPIKARDYRVEIKDTMFNQIIGIPEAKEALQHYVDFLKKPQKYTSLGARFPKGCLLTGKPGTGKTLLARAVASEAGTPFFACNGADFIEVFGGSGPQRVRELFSQAKAVAPSVIFIDEIDAIGNRKQDVSSGGDRGASEENRTINQLLAELDGLATKESIVVLAATNYPGAVDKALTREGRFDQKIDIPLPDNDARRELFEFYLSRIVTGDPNCKPEIQTFQSGTVESKDENSTPKAKESETKTATSKKINIVKITPKIIEGISNKDYAMALAARTPGVTPAQISTIVNEAALYSANLMHEVVSKGALDESIDDVLIGRKHQQKMVDKDLYRTAYHEVGHAIMAWCCPLQKEVITISIIPRGKAGGYTQQIQNEALDPQTEAFVFSQLCLLLGGRAAEHIFMKDISIGAMDDLQRATSLAMETLLHRGMSHHIGPLAFQKDTSQEGRGWMKFSEQLHAQVEREAIALVEKAFRKTVSTILLFKEKHITLATQLLEKKKLDKYDVESILGPKATILEKSKEKSVII